MAGAAFFNTIQSKADPFLYRLSRPVTLNWSMRVPLITFGQASLLSRSPEAPADQVEPFPDRCPNGHSIRLPKQRTRRLTTAIAARDGLHFPYLERLKATAPQTACITLHEGDNFEPVPATNAVVEALAAGPPR